MNRILEPILVDVRRRAAERRREQPLTALRRDARPDPARRARFHDALGAEGLSIIAECKRRSPSAGVLFEGDLAARAAAYAQGGARALSVLTERDHFGGAPEDLRELASVGLPRLRKDFVLDEGMVLESLVMGADAVLLIAACLEPRMLRELSALAGELGLFRLVEVHHESELEAAFAAEPDAVGVNARDLKTFAVDVDGAARLLAAIPPGPLRVAESGLRSPADLRRARDAGADAALVGEALVTAPDPAARLEEWLHEL